MGGKSSPPPPDYGPLTALSRDQLAFAKQQYAEMAPLARQVAAQQMAAQQQQMRQAQDYYDYQQQTFRPLERGLVADAERFNTDAYREQLASQAAAATGRAFGATQGMQQRALASMGVNPNSGRAMAMSNQMTLGLAAQRANAMTGARQQADQLGYARRMEAAGLGRGLAGASSTAYGGATSAGNAGLASSMAPGTQFQQGMGAAGYSMGNILGSQTSAYNASMQQSDPLAQIVGTGLGIYAGRTSDRRLKQDIELVGRDERTGLNLYEFSYKNAPGKRYVGVMADEVAQVKPEAVITMLDGFMAVNYAMLGIEMIEVEHG